ncbi:hypothetical protein GCM10027091_70010 [Streptomyces daliensis]
MWATVPPGPVRVCPLTERLPTPAPPPPPTRRRAPRENGGVPLPPLPPLPPDALVPCLPSPLVPVRDEDFARRGVRLLLKRDDLIHKALPGYQPTGVSRVDLLV